MLMRQHYQMMVYRFQNHVLSISNRLHFIYLMIFLLFPPQIFAKIEAQKDWYCICYSELNEQNQAIPVTSCRSDYEQCIKLADKINRQGSKIIVKNSAISGCAEIKGPFPWSNLIESKEIDWLESKLKGAAWTPKGCFLDEQMRKQNPIIYPQVFVLNQEIDQSVKEGLWRLSEAEKPIDKKKIYQSYQKLIEKKEIGQYQPDQQYYQHGTIIIEPNYTKAEEQLLNDYYQTFARNCWFIPEATNEKFEFKRIGWLESGKNYYITSSKGVSQQKIKKISYQSKGVGECISADLYPYYQLETQEKNQCFMISTAPLKYPIVKEFKPLNIKKEFSKFTKIKNLVEKNITKVLSNIKSIQKYLSSVSMSQFSNTNQYEKIYEINPNQFYLMIDLQFEDQVIMYGYLILKADLNQKKLSLINYSEAVQPISIECEIDRNQDGKSEISVIFASEDASHETLIINDQLLDDGEITEE
jgi:hypothetical protein